VLTRLREALHHWRHPVGLNSEAEAEQFAAELKAEALSGEPVRTVSEPTPIHDQLAREFAARRTADESETHRVFLSLVSDWGAGSWRCTFCEGPDADHQWCPGCSCPCGSVHA
jgi:hypothetical protein